MSSYALTSIYIPETIKTINTGGFHNNLLESIVIPKGITRIERDSISYNQLKTIVIPEGVEYLGPFSFENNQLESVVLPSSLKVIDDGAFWYNVIPEITIPNGVEKIGKYAFYINLLNNLNIPPSVNSVGIRSFNNNLLPDNKAFIYARNIDGTKDLTRIVSYGGARRDNIEIPSTVITISENTFYLYETEIESIVIPNGVTTIEKDAFSSSLKNITLPSNVNIQTDSITTNFYNTYVINNASAAGTYTAPFFFGTWTKQ